jgi:hypothetical protein
MIRRLMFRSTKIVKANLTNEAIARRLRGNDVNPLQLSRFRKGTIPRCERQETRMASRFGGDSEERPNQVD